MWYDVHLTQLLSTIRDHFKESGDIRIRFTYEPLIGAMIQITRRLKDINVFKALTLRNIKT